MILMLIMQELYYSMQAIIAKYANKMTGQYLFGVQS